MLNNRVHSDVTGNTLTNEAAETSDGQAIPPDKGGEGVNDISPCISIRDSLTPIITWLRVFGLYHESTSCVDTQGFTGIKPNESQDTPLEQLSNFGEGARGTCRTALRPSKSPSFKAVSRAFTAITFMIRARLVKSSQTLQRFYCVTVSLLLVANFLRSLLLLFRESGFGLSYRVVMVIWYSHTTLGTLVSLYSCWKESHFRLFFKQWVQLYSDPKTRALGFTPITCRKWVSVVTIGSITSLLLNVLMVAMFALLDAIPMSKYMRILICQPFPVTWWSLLLALTTHVFNTAAWTLLCGLTVCLALVMSTHFTRLKTLIRTNVKKSDGHIPASLPGLRVCHLRMCKLLDTLNRYFRLYLAVNLTFSLAANTFILYQIVAVRGDQWTLLGNIWWFAGTLLAVLSTSVSLSMLHESAHSPLEELFSMDPVEADTSQAVQLQLFLHKLTGTTIGATVMDLFVVTKEVLLTVTGAFLTYFFLVMQFGI